MNSIELEAGKMELIRMVSDISTPDLLAKARKALLQALEVAKKDKTEEKPLREALKRIEGIKSGKISSRPIQEFLNEI